MKKLLFLLILLEVSSFATADEPWDPPIGIPAPSFGINEDYTMYNEQSNRNPELTYYESSSGGYYTHYIDNTNPNATDSDNPYGTEEKPRQTLPACYPTPYPAGSVIEIHGGPYEYGGKNSLGYSTVSIICNGTQQYPIFIRGVESPIFKSFGFILTGTYFIIEKVKLENCYTQFNKNNESSYVSIRDIELYDLRDTTTAINVGISQGTNYDQVHDIVVYDSYIHDCGDMEAIQENDRMGVTISYGHNFWVLNCIMHHMSGDAVHINTEEPYIGRFAFVGKNTFYSCKENAVDIKEFSDAIVSENTCYDFHPVSSSDGTALVNNEDNPHSNIWYLFNYVYDAVNGIRFQDTCNIIGNRFYNLSGDGILGANLARKQVNILCNIVYNVGNRGIANGTGFEECTVHIHNNIVMDAGGCDVYIRGYTAEGEQESISDRSTISDNYFYKTGDSVKISWGYGTDSIYESLADFKLRTGKGEGCAIGNPLFEKPDEGNFTLGEGSPIDNMETAPETQAAIDMFFQLYGIDLSQYFNDVSGPIPGPQDDSDDDSGNSVDDPGDSVDDSDDSGDSGDSGDDPEDPVDNIAPSNPDDTVTQPVVDTTSSMENNNQSTNTISNDSTITSFSTISTLSNASNGLHVKDDKAATVRKISVRSFFQRFDDIYNAPNKNSSYSGYNE